MPANPFAPTGVDLNTPSMFDPQQGQTPDQTTTAQDVVDDQNQKQKEADAEDKIDPKIKKRNDEFRSRIDICKIYRRKLIANWTVSIDYRRGKPFTSQTDMDQIAVNLDWAFTKAKQAALFSQVPQVRVNHGEDLLPGQQPWVIPFQKKLNDTLVDSGIESAMEECLPDLINAAGLGIVLVSYEAMTEDVALPTKTPPLSTEPGDVGSGSDSTPDSDTPPDTTTIPRVVDHRYLIQRISPADFLWPINYTGSNFDNAPWIGRSGRLTWSEAKKQFNLRDQDRERILGEDKVIMDRLTHDVERDKVEADDMVGFDELFYFDYRYDDDARSYRTIHRLVFCNGKTEPVIDEPWKGQKFDPQTNTVTGAQRYPIRVLTLTYITDETIPPSDTAIGRPQVNEINKGRTQMIHQRERSLPVRWFDVNRVDPAIQQSLMRGVWQAMIPVQGDGQRILGEVARGVMPPENFNFDKIAKSDLQMEWTIPSQDDGEGREGGENEKSTGGVSLPHVRERAKVASFVVSVAEVLGGLICLYEEATPFGQGFSPDVSKFLKYSVLADSTILLDSNQRLQRLNNFVNTYGKSGWVNLEPVLQEIAQLSGLDPTVAIKAPMPKPPVEPNISLRLTGVEDLLNPLSLAMLIKSGQAPQQQQIEMAKALIQQAVVPPVNPTQGPPGPGGQIAPPVGPPPPGSQPPPPLPPKVGEANPQMSIMPTIMKRSEPGGVQ
jgi:hypothetical protein